MSKAFLDISIIESDNSGNHVKHVSVGTSNTLVVDGLMALLAKFGIDFDDYDDADRVEIHEDKKPLEPPAPVTPIATPATPITPAPTETGTSSAGTTEQK